MASTHPEFLWMNGECVAWESAMVHVSQLGWSTVGGVFEGIRAYRGEDGQLYLFRLGDHLHRLVQSMKLVRYQIDYTVDQLSEAVIGLLMANRVEEDTYVFPFAYARDATSRSFDSFPLEATIQISTRPEPSRLNTQESLDVSVSSWRRISDDVMPPRIKNLSNYRNGQLARMEAKIDGYDDAILLNSFGKVAEAPGACVFMVRNGVVVTSDVTAGILESITRDSLIRLLRDDLGIPVEERSLDRTELLLADEAFICGTAAEITPISSVDRYDLGDRSVGPVTASLSVLYDEVLRGKTEVYPEWRTEVLS